MAARSRQDLPPRPPTPGGNLIALRQEFAEQGVGPLLVGEVQAVAYVLVPRYNAAVYSEIGNWRHGFDDLVQDVVADSLLRDRQADYMLLVAVTIGDFRRLLHRQVRRCLARRRSRTVIDNLLKRAAPILAGPGFERRARHQSVTYAGAGAPAEDRAATFPEVSAAARAIRNIPQQISTTRDQAPMVYTTSNLVLVLETVAATLPVAFTVGELDHVLRLVLPHLLPSVLDQSGVERHSF